MKSTGQITTFPLEAAVALEKESARMCRMGKRHSRARIVRTAILIRFWSGGSLNIFSFMERLSV